MLSPETRNYLSKIFVFRKVKHGKAKKFAVPIGVHTFTVRKVIDRVSKSGNRVVEMWMYVPPMEEVYGTVIATLGKEDKLSLAPIKTYHTLGKGDTSSFYRRFSSMNEESLDKLLEMKGHTFNGLVKHSAKDIMLDGRVERGAFGERRVYWVQEIISIAEVGEDINFDYLDLIDFGIQDVKRSPIIEYVPF